MTRHMRAIDLRGYLRRTLSGERREHVRGHLDDCLPCWNAWNRFRWDHARSTRLYAELAEFLGSDFQPYFDSSHALAREWDDTNPVTEEETRDFFRASTSYLYNLVVWEASGNRPDYLSAARQVLHRVRPCRIVDYGCGIGSDTLALLGCGFAVTPCDFRSPSTAFLRWRAARSGTSVDHVVEPQELSGSHDVVWIIDTLDHIADIDKQLGPVLAGARLVICENMSSRRAHGRQRFHHRRPSGQLTRMFARYGLVPTEQSTRVGHSCPITTWVRH